MKKTRVRFWGCRGSFPTFDENKIKYGGDTSCVEIRTPDNKLIILDMGTGLRRLGERIVNDSSYPKEIHIFLSHYHLDHIHGFLMFAPLFNPKYTINIYSRNSNGKNSKQIFDIFLQPEIWPINVDFLPSKINFIEMNEDKILINNSIEIRNNPHPHPPLEAFSIRIKIFDKIITYITDCEHSPEALNENVVNFADQSDLLIHDAQYSISDLPKHKGWGHSSWKNAVDVAIKSDSKKLVLFHHSPDYDDSEIDGMEIKAKLNFSNVIAAKQNLEIEL